MNIATRKKQEKLLGELDLNIRDRNIKNVKEGKYVGLHNDRHLSWKSSWIQHLKRSLMPLEYGSMQYILKNMYISMIASHF